MKKFISVLLSTVMVASIYTVSVVSASANVTEFPDDWNPTQYSYTVVGDANLLGEYAWQPENDDYNMSYDEATGIWYINLIGVGNLGKQDFDYGAQYKVVVRDYDPTNPWAFSLNENGVAYGLDSNSLVDFGDEAETAKSVTILFDGQKTASHIDDPYIPQGEEEHTYFAVGSTALFDPAWDPSAFEMSANASTGLYEVTIPVSEDQWDCCFEYRIARDGNWNVSYNDEGLAKEGDINAVGYIEEGATAVTITWNPNTQCAGFNCLVDKEDPTELTINGVRGTLYFDSTGPLEDAIHNLYYCYVWSSKDGAIYDWGTKETRMTRVSDKLFSYDVPRVNLGDDPVNADLVIFSALGKGQTYETTFSDSCFGDTAYIIEEPPLYGVQDDYQGCYACAWRHNPQEGTHIFITSTGKVYGVGILSTETPESIADDFIADYKKCMEEGIIGYNNPGLITDEARQGYIDEINKIIAEHSKEEPEKVAGDLNGDGRLSTSDAVIMQRALLGLMEVTSEQQKLCDINGDGKLSTADVILVMRKILNQV